MSDERLSSLLRLCEQALTREGAERAAYLDAACGADRELRRDVEALLAHELGTAAAFLDTPPWQRPAATLAEGQRLGPYEVTAKIGAGGMGAVYRARDTRLGRTVALKVIAGAGAMDSDARDRFTREARTIAALSHPNICALHDVGREGDIDFLVMEYLDGETLQRRLHRDTEDGTCRRLDVDEAVQIAIQIAEGLAAAHEAGVVHRDLKPANIILVNGAAGRHGLPQVKLLDFGLAKPRTAIASAAVSKGETGGIASSVTGPGVRVGTAGYMSPEQARGEGVDPRSDVFALGCVLYEMLAGERPFRGATPTDVLAAILRDDPPPLSTSGRVPPGLDRIVRHCLEKHPAARFQSARDVVFALESSAKQGTAGIATRPRTSRRWRLVAASVGLILLAASYAGLFVWLKGSLASPVPSFRRLTFRRGWVNAARFAPDGQTVVYSAAWDGGPNEVFSVRLGSPESQPMGHSRAELLAVSPTGELALNLRSRPRRYYDQWAGTLARVAFSGGTPRPLDEQVTYADWSPDGKDLAVVRETDTSDQLEYPLGHVLYTSTGHISWARVSPTGDRVAFLDSQEYLGGRDSVALVDKAGRKTTLTPPFQGNASGLAWSPSGDEIWFTAATSGRTQELRAVAPGGRQRLLLRDLVSIRLLDVAKDGRVLLAHVQRRARCFFRGETDTNDREMSWLDSPVLMGLSRDARYVLFNEWGEGIGADLGRVYLRETTGAPPTLLGIGSGMAFSPDERLVVGRVEDRDAVAIYPIGTGQPWTIPMVKGFKLLHVAGLLPDGQTVVIAGNETSSRGVRIWLTDLAGSKPRPISPEGVAVMPHVCITPDGRFVVGMSDGIAAGRRTLAYPVAGGESQPFKGLLDGEEIVGWGPWGPDGEWFFTYRALKIFRVDHRTGARTLVHEIVPTDSAGRLVGRSALVAADGKAYAYTTSALQSELHLVQGVK